MLDRFNILIPKGVDAAAIAGFLVAEEEEGPDYSDFGGLHEVVERAKELIELPLRYHDALAQIGARPIKGVHFTGPPGTGKTMLARIIANRAGAKFYEIRGPEIFSKWYGESEGLLRGIFDEATEGSAIDEVPRNLDSDIVAIYW